MNDTEQAATQQVVVVRSEKNVGIAVILGVLLGPLGMVYSTIPGAIIMFIVSLLLAILTLGLSILLTQPVCAIWAGLAANGYNKKVRAGATR